jgi:hypothetical protein
MMTGNPTMSIGLILYKLRATADGWSIPQQRAQQNLFGNEFILEVLRDSLRKRLFQVSAASATTSPQSAPRDISDRMGAPAPAASTAPAPARDIFDRLGAQPVIVIPLGRHRTFS